MENYDLPNQQELQPDIVHNYDLVPQQYSIEDNNTVSTYNQFIQLRDTLVYSGKKYPGKAWSKLIIGEKEQTVEIQWKNWLKIWFEPNIAPETTTINYHEGPYVEYTPTEWDFTQGQFLAKHGYDYNKRVQNFWLISCRILQDGNYRVEYKVQVGSNATPIPAWTTKIYAFVIRYKYKDDLLVPWEIGTNDSDPDTQNANRFHIAVWDLQQPSGWTQKTLTGHTTWTDPNWSCSVSLTLTLADLYTKITAIGFNDTNLDKNDVLSFHVVNQNFQSLDACLQGNSNFFSVKYSDLPLKY